jgi:hypothetical protein
VGVHLGHSLFKPTLFVLYKLKAYGIIMLSVYIRPCLSLRPSILSVFEAHEAYDIALLLRMSHLFSFQCGLCHIKGKQANSSFRSLFCKSSPGRCIKVNFKEKCCDCTDFIRPIRSVFFLFICLIFFVCRRALVRYLCLLSLLVESLFYQNFCLFSFTHTSYF